MPALTAEQPYLSLSSWCQEVYGERLYKIALDAGLTCPNRDGRLGSRGCIFCSAGGSGDFAAGPIGIVDPAASIRAQLKAGRALIAHKAAGMKYIAYFQAYTNTYGPLPYLETIWRTALEEDDIAGISIGTRPDCLEAPILDLLTQLKEDFPDKFIWVELGLQTIHEDTARYIRRGYALPVFEEAVQNLSARSLPVIVHVILGLPGEDPDRMLATIRYLNDLPIFGIKLQLLHVLRETDLATDYLAGKFEVLTEASYIDLLCDILANLRPDIVLHRLTGDGPKDLLIAPLWSGNKRHVLNELRRQLKVKSIRQGCRL